MEQVEEPAMEPAGGLEVDLSPEEMKEAEREVILCKLHCYVFLTLVFLPKHIWQIQTSK